MMHGHGDRSQGCMQPQEMMIEKMWDELSDEHTYCTNDRFKDPYEGEHDKIPEIQN